jgi:hypothetical protein
MKNICMYQQQNFTRRTAVAYRLSQRNWRLNINFVPALCCYFRLFLLKIHNKYIPEKQELLYIPHVQTLNVDYKQIKNSTKLGRPLVRSLKINHEMIESLAGETERVFTWSWCYSGIFLLKTIQKIITSHYFEPLFPQTKLTKIKEKCTVNIL